MIHQRPVPCPSVKDIYASDHSPACSTCFNGFIYYAKSEFVGAFMGNNLNRRFGPEGTWDIDDATIVIPVKDSRGDILDIQYFDQILLPDFTVRYYQRVEHSQSGIDRPQFKAVKIDFVMDANGKIYRPGVDVVADSDGRIKWIGERPGYDVKTNRGVVYSINYYTNPVFSIVGLPHQLRAAQTQDLENGGNNIPARFPQLAVVRKDFIPFDEADKTGAADRPEPASGTHGPGPHIRTSSLNDKFGL